MKTIISVDGGKGGTGKSVVSSAFIDTALSKGKKVLVIEADTSNPDIAKSYENACEIKTLCLDTREGFIELATAVHQTEAEIIIINNPARSEKWGQFGDVFINNLSRLDAKMMVVWVANRQQDSLELCRDFFEKYPYIPVIFCMNSYFGASHKFEVWGTSKTRSKILAAGGGEIVFPDCADRVMHSMRKARLRWDQIEELEFGDFIEAERVRREAQELLKPYII